MVQKSAGERETNPVGRFTRILVANRGEIAIRVLRAANEMNKATVAVFAEEDRLALHPLERPMNPTASARGSGRVTAYLSIDEIIRVAGARPAATPSIPATASCPSRRSSPKPAPGQASPLSGRVPTPCGSSATRYPRGKPPPARAYRPFPPPTCSPTMSTRPWNWHPGVGFPGIIKASWGGGGRGMRRVDNTDEFADACLAARREAAVAFGKDSIYFERFVGRARHLEVPDSRRR